MSSHDAINRRQSTMGTELVLLGFMCRAPTHGYEIYHRLTDTPELRLIWRIKQSRLYAMLDRLEREGLLEVRHIAQEGRPPRKMLSLSSAGQAAYRHWVEEPVALPRDMRLTFMLKLYFAMQEGSEQAIRLLDAQHARCREWLLAQEAQMATVESDGRDYGDMVQTFRHGQMQAMMVWLNDCRDRLV